ncbi:hypothetical protein GGX14DRAFT_577788 [Mycena pura]|uniref:Uncharacterized protein n=1 Tax=Mycena pura TaxID=153505 RepID=A0AAD6UU33_9AGAR|nr:hypothetical protein GGX14DRAFT_577788 [Mycena pura]
MPLKIGPGKVGQQFNDTLATIRDEAHRTLRAQAIDWLKAARYKLMRQLEARYVNPVPLSVSVPNVLARSFRQLEQSRDTPASQPAYVDPAKSLQLSTDPLPPPLFPYSSAFQNNLRDLLRDCGFHYYNVVMPAAQPDRIFIIIGFPAQLPPLPQTLHVEDEISRATAQEGCKPVADAFSATTVGRIVDVRSESSSAPRGNPSGSRKRPRVASPAVEEGSDAGGSRRLSTTGASSCLKTPAAIRDEAPTVEALEPQAIDWLKAARYNVMRQLEASYYQLEQTRNTPASQPAYVDPTQSLQLTTDPVPKSLSPTAEYRCLPQFLHVEDEFSRPVRGGSQKDDKAAVGTFTATNFGRLLIDARGESGTPRGSGSRKRHRAASLEVKEESDAGGGRRLRSTTRATSSATLRATSSTTLRATSSATLRSDGGNPRRSGRNRIKREE